MATATLDWPLRLAVEGIPARASGAWVFNNKNTRLPVAARTSLSRSLPYAEEFAVRGSCPAAVTTGSLRPSQTESVHCAEEPSRSRIAMTE